MSLIEETFMHRFVRPQVLALALLWMILTPALALAAGEAGFAFLKLGVGARPMGMGSAYVALADDPTAVYWNPAGLASAEGTQLLVMHNEWIQDFRQEFAAVSGSLGPGAFGFGLSGFYTSEFEGRDDVGTLTRHFGFNDLAVTGAYAYRFAAGGRRRCGEIHPRDDRPGERDGGRLRFGRPAWNREDRSGAGRGGTESGRQGEVRVGVLPTADDGARGRFAFARDLERRG